MTSVALAAVLAGAAAAVLLVRPAEARLRQALPALDRPLPGGAGPPRSGSGRGAPLDTAHAGRCGGPGRRAPALAGSVAVRGACALAAVALVLLVPWPLGVLAGLAAGVLGPKALARLEPRAARTHREQLVAELPLALDLLAACLAGGAPLAAAASAVGAALPGPAGARLAGVASALQVGAPPAEAWAVLAGPDQQDDPLAPAARALARAADGGAPVAAAVARLAADARREQRSAGTRAARRAGVLAVAPLGLCFLPAFVLLGIVPVVAGLAGPLLASQ